MDIEKDTLDSVITDVINTFKFHGVEITKMSFSYTTPTFNITIYKKQQKKRLEDTLNFVYWVLWTLVYGEYSEDKYKNSQIELNYILVE